MNSLKFLIPAVMIFSCTQKVAESTQKKDVRIFESTAAFSKTALVGIGIIELARGFDTYQMSPVIRKENDRNWVDFDDKRKYLGEIYQGVTASSEGLDMRLSPRLLNVGPDFVSIAFDCVRVTEDSYVVMINKQTAELAEIKKDDARFTYLDLNTYAQEHTKFGFEFDPSTNPLRTAPSDDASLAISDKGDSAWKNAKSSRIEAEWMEIQVSETQEKGWIRWRNGEDMLIRFNEGC